MLNVFRRRRQWSVEKIARSIRPAIEALEGRTLFAFGVTTTATSYVVDNGANLTFSILRGGTISSTIHMGDLTSVKYMGQELLATNAFTSRYSHYEQGLGSMTILSATVDPNGQWILITADDSANTASATQYYAVRKGDDTLYMASLPTDVTAGPGEGRFIAYLDRSVFSNPEAPSDNMGSTGAIEGSDVFGHADGTTTSKYYNMGRRMIENQYHGVVGSAAGSSVGAWMYMGNREHSAGGPFFKDIDFQASSAAVEMYNCVFTGHTQTEAYRQGLYTYGMSFNGGHTPAAQLYYSWMSALNLKGWIPDSARGTITGTVSGVQAGHEKVVALSNSTEQYWAFADATTGAYSITGVHAGTYTETLYDNELAVGTRTVTISGGQTTGADIASTFYLPSATWRIGSWDGTPLGFLNSDKIENMHPSDIRMGSWTATPNFVIGTNTDSQWSMTQFMGVNNSQRITFNLTSAQVAAAQTLRIGITLGFEGGRNRITVNSGQTYAWTSSIPAASTDLNSRGITRGTWRGPNQLYTYNIPTSALKAGINTIDLPVVSGSYVAGQTWPSPNVTYDAIDLVPTASLTGAPVVSSIAITPANPTLTPGSQQKFVATAKDQFGNVTPANIVWSATRGTIDNTGAYIAPATTGSDTITATYNGITATAAVSVDTAPTVATAAAATPNPVLGTSTLLSVLGADNNGEANLTYYWATIGSPPAAVSFSDNGTNGGMGRIFFNIFLENVMTLS